MTIHYFDHTGDAYDACQCRDDIKNGDTLIIEDDAGMVVGIAGCWPVAVTKSAGHLHRAEPSYPMDKFLAEGSLTEEHVRRAVAEAVWLGEDLDAPFLAFAIGAGLEARA